MLPSAVTSLFPDTFNSGLLADSAISCWRMAACLASFGAWVWSTCCRGVRCGTKVVADWKMGAEVAVAGELKL